MPGGMLKYSTWKNSSLCDGKAAYQPALRRLAYFSTSSLMKRANSAGVLPNWASLTFLDTFGKLTILSEVSYGEKAVYG